MRWGWKPERPSSLARNMEKHPPKDAAINSSGLVPMPCAKRVWNEYRVSESTPLSVVIVPVPSRRVPFQTTDAFRFINNPREQGDRADVARDTALVPAAPIPCWLTVIPFKYCQAVLDLLYPKIRCHGDSSSAILRRRGG